MSNENEENSIRTMMTDIDKKVEIIYRHQSIMADYSAIPRDYGTGHLVSEVEAHTLLYIFQEAGLTATRLSEKANRTKGTISQVVSKLEKQGLIYREVNPDNKREYRLFVTEKGEYFCTQHLAFDRERTIGIMTKLLQVCSPEELDAFFKVLRLRTQFFGDIIDYDKRKLLSHTQSADEHTGEA